MTPDEKTEINQMIDEKLAKLNVGNTNKSKRAPNKWQVFLKDCIPKQKDKSNLGEKVRACSIEYKKPTIENEIIEKIENEQEEE